MTDYLSNGTEVKTYLIRPLGSNAENYTYRFTVTYQGIEYDVTIASYNYAFIWMNFSDSSLDINTERGCSRISTYENDLLAFCDSSIVTEDELDSQGRVVVDYTVGLYESFFVPKEDDDGKYVEILSCTIDTSPADFYKYTNKIDGSVRLPGNAYKCYFVNDEINLVVETEELDGNSYVINFKLVLIDYYNLIDICVFDRIDVIKLVDSYEDISSPFTYTETSTDVYSVTGTINQMDLLYDDDESNFYVHLYENRLAFGLAEYTLEEGFFISGDNVSNVPMPVYSERIIHKAIVVDGVLEFTVQIVYGGTTKTFNVSLTIVQGEVNIRNLVTWTIGDNSKTATFTDDLRDLVDDDFVYEKDSATRGLALFEIDFSGEEDYVVVDGENIYIKTTIAINSEIAPSYMLYEMDEETELTYSNGYYLIPLFEDGDSWGYFVFALTFTYNEIEYSYLIAASYGGENPFELLTWTIGETSKVLTFNNDLTEMYDDDFIYESDSETSTFAYFKAEFTGEEDFIVEDGDGFYIKTTISIIMFGGDLSFFSFYQEDGETALTVSDGYYLIPVNIEYGYAMFVMTFMTNDVVYTYNVFVDFSEEFFELFRWAVGNESKKASFTPDLRNLTRDAYIYAQQTKTSTIAYFFANYTGSEEFIETIGSDLFVKSTITMLGDFSQSYSLYTSDGTTPLTYSEGYYLVPVNVEEGNVIFVLKFTYNEVQYTYTVCIDLSGTEFLIWKFGSFERYALFNSDLTNLHSTEDFNYKEATSNSVTAYFHASIQGTEDFVLVDGENYFIKTYIYIDTSLVPSYNLYQEDGETDLTFSDDHYIIPVNTSEGYAAFILVFTKNSVEYTYTISVDFSGGGGD